MKRMMVMRIVVSLSLVVLAIFVLFLMSFEWHPPSNTAGCLTNLNNLYIVIRIYGEENGSLPTSIEKDDLWAKPFLEPDTSAHEKEGVRKTLTCPTERDTLSSVSKWTSSYTMNTDLLGKKWEVVSSMETPLLIEKRPNHYGKHKVLHANGLIKSLPGDALGKYLKTDH